MTEGTKRPVDEAKEGIKEGIRAVTGMLAALKDAIEETIDDLKERGELSPDRAKQAAKDTMKRAQDAVEEMKERVDFVPRKEFDALRAELDALRVRVGTLESKHAGPHGHEHGEGDKEPPMVGTASTLNKVTETLAKIRVVKEERRGDTPLFVHPAWHEQFPWLVQGTTPREAGNFASFGDQPAEAVHAQWHKLRQTTGLHSVVLGRQVHGARVLEHGKLAHGWLIADASDGHVTSEPDTLLAVSVADCVPVFVVHPGKRTVAVLHAGWRGTAANIMSACIAITGPAVHVHLGPAICGSCYEVGPEVHSALGLPQPGGNEPVDLRAVLAQQALALGVAQSDITTSAWCTRCGNSPFYSHRAGHSGRQVGVIGIV